ncbi:hypothetical protein Ccrd_018558, partial [Cynara cardunculus var. scolymus]
LGCAFFTVGIVHYPKVQRFNQIHVKIQQKQKWNPSFVSNYVLQTVAIVSSELLLMAVMGILFPASELALSRFSSCIMLVAYASYLFFQLKSHANLYDSIDEVGHLILEVLTVDVSMRCNSIFVFHIPVVYGPLLIGSH